MIREAHPLTAQYTYWSIRPSARSTNKGWRLVRGEGVATVEVRSGMPGTDHVPIVQHLE